VAMGASCEPPAGLPDIASVVEALRGLDAEKFVIVEQDLYPVAFDVPGPIAARTHDYLRSTGVG
jgi:inosose dehydratase